MENTVDVTKIHPRIMHALRQREHSEQAIAQMSPVEAFSEFCKFHGFAGTWGATLASVLDNLRAAAGKTPTPQ